MKISTQPHFGVFSTEKKSCPGLLQHVASEFKSYISLSIQVKNSMFAFQHVHLFLFFYSIAHYSVSYVSVQVIIFLLFFLTWVANSWGNQSATKRNHIHFNGMYITISTIHLYTYRLTTYSSLLYCLQLLKRNKSPFTTWETIWKIIIKAFSFKALSATALLRFHPVATFPKDFTTHLHPMPSICHTPSKTTTMHSFCYCCCCYYYYY